MAKTIAVADIALARSGDKGSDANVGVWARSEEGYRILEEQLTAEVVNVHFAEVCRGGVTRYQLPNLRALNFVLHDALGGGGSATMRTDAQGKVYGLAIGLVRIGVPDDFEP
jgi:hypothetical protein